MLEAIMQQTDYVKIHDISFDYDKDENVIKIIFPEAHNDIDGNIKLTEVIITFSIQEFLYFAFELFAKYKKEPRQECYIDIERGKEVIIKEMEQIRDDLCSKNTGK